MYTSFISISVVDIALIAFFTLSLQLFFYLHMHQLVASQSIAQNLHPHQAQAQAHFGIDRFDNVNDAAFLGLDE